MPSPSETPTTWTDAIKAKKRARRLVQMIEEQRYGVSEAEATIKANQDIIDHAQRFVDERERMIRELQAEICRLKEGLASVDPTLTTSRDAAADSVQKFTDAIRHVQSALDRHEAHIEELAESADTTLLDETHEASRADAVRLFSIKHECKQPDALDFLTPELLRDRAILAEDILIELVKQDGAAAHPDLIVKRAYGVADALIAQSRGAF